MRLDRPLRAPAAALLVFALGTASALAGERVRGDLAPIVSDPARILEADLSDQEARALFEAVHKALIERLGEDQVADRELYLGAALGMIEAANRSLHATGGPLQEVMPPSGMLLPDADAARLSEDLGGSMTGLGIQFRRRADLGGLEVLGVIPGSPSARGGLQPGDLILEAEGRALRELSQEETLSILQGEAGTSLTLALWRRGDGTPMTMRVTLQRSVFPVPTVDERLTSEGVGVVSITRMHRGTPGEVAEALRGLGRLGADRFVLDLRGCGGGALESAAAIAGLFLPDGTVLMRAVEPGLGEEDLVARGEPAFEGDLVVLIDRWTHGAAEAVAAALQDHGRAYLIGERTFGSARTETLVTLGAGYTLRLPAVRLETAGGRSWQSRGIRPDSSIEAMGPVPLPVDPTDPGALDPQFQHALHYLGSR